VPQVSDIELYELFHEIKGKCTIADHGERGSQSQSMVAKGSYLLLKAPEPLVVREGSVDLLSIHNPSVPGNESTHCS